MGISDITAADLQDDIIGPILIKEYKEQVTKRMKDDKYTHNLAIYVNSIFQDFESFLRTEVGLVEDDNRLVLDEYNSSFITYELDPAIYSYKDISKALFNILQPEYPASHSEILIRLADITTKTKLVVIPGIIAKRFDEKSFYSTILGFTSGWEYKHYNQYISQKIVNLGSTNRIHLKCDVIDGSVVNSSRQPILYSFVYKVFCKPETIHFKKNQ